MDPYERLAAINEEITRLKRPHRVQKKKQTRRAKEISQAIDKAANTQEDPKEVEARLAAFYDKQDKSIFGESTEKIDQEFDDARDALRKAGVPNMGLRAIGSMDRERNRLRVHPKFEKEAKQALKGFPKVDLEINDKMPEQPMKRK